VRERMDIALTIGFTAAAVVGILVVLIASSRKK